MSINGFNIAAERIDLLIAIALLYLTVVTRPKRTAVLSVVFYGQILSIVNIVFHIAVIWLIHFTTTTEGILFRVCVFVYYISYLAILLLIFSYIHLLSLDQREDLTNLHRVAILFSASYLLVVGCIFFTDGYIVLKDGVYQFTNLFGVNIIFALADVLLVICSVAANCLGIPKVLMKFLYVFIPFETALLVFQLLRPNYVFLSVTYVLPLIMCFIIFHSNSFDEVTGCQNKQAFDSHYTSLIRKNKSFTTIFMKLPRLEIVDNAEINYRVHKYISEEIRALERFNEEVRVYHVGNYTYGIIFENKTELTTSETLAFIKKELNESMERWEYSNNPEYQMIVVRDNIQIENTVTLDAFMYFLFERASKKKENNYEASILDYNLCVEQRKIERVIVDIRNKDDLFDPRVIVYVQPIYDVKNNNYHNAEALMRLDVNGQIIAPDIFIPLAERVGCVHALTRIILNKVCRKIYEIQDYYVFDAVSVNVSLSEFMDYNLHDELLAIIKKNGVSCSKIRLEMTETMTTDEMDAIAHNMEEFNAAGVHFYLDDFGTGYSNLEKIVSLPFKTIKFDKTLLYRSMDDPILLQLIQNMVDVFKSHGLVVLVEGVENGAQAELSIKLGFEYIQGFNYAAPVPMNQVENFFEDKIKEKISRLA